MTNARNWHFWAGVILAGGVSLFAPVGMYGLLALQVHRRFHLHRPVVLLACLVGVSVFLSTDWLEPLEWGIRAVLLASLFPHLRANKPFVLGASLVGLIQLGFAVAQLHDGIGRPYGISANASSLGLGAFTFIAVHPLTAFWASPLLGISGSRTYLLTAGLLALLTRNRLRFLYVILAGVTALVVAIQTNQFERFTPSAWAGSAERRISEYAPANIEPLGSVQQPESVERSLWQTLTARPLGLGYRDYNHETGRVNPHNQFLLLFWELGWLAVPFLLVLACMARQSSIPWRYWLVLLPGLLLTDEWFARPEGMFSLSLILLSLTRFVDVWKLEE